MARYTVGVTVKFSVPVETGDPELVPDLGILAAEKLLAGYSIDRIWWEYFMREDENGRKEAERA